MGEQILPRAVSSDYRLVTARPSTHQYAIVAIVLQPAFTPARGSVFIG